MNEIQPQNLSDYNPFESNGNSLANRVNAGAVMVEQERAIAEVKGKIMVAKMFPRDQAAAFQNVMDACSRRSLAEIAEYKFRRGNEDVVGPTIRLAEVLAAAWGNIDYGMRELSRGEGYSEMEAYAWDMQTNVISSQKFTVNHIRDKTGGGQKVTAERDIYELTANNAARRLRERIFAVIPADLVDAAVRKCRETIAGNSTKPTSDRVREMISRFNKFGVTAAMIEVRLNRKLDAILPEDFIDLNQVFNAVRDGAPVSEYFGGQAPALTAPEEPKPAPTVAPKAKPKATPKAEQKPQEAAQAVKPEDPVEDTPAPVLTPPAADDAPAEVLPAGDGSDLSELF